MRLVTVMVASSLYNVYNKSGNTSEAVIVADLV
ncbi:hypothetical protein VPH184E373B_0128 [Vibrio phage 184E37-3b]